MYLYQAMNYNIQTYYTKNINLVRNEDMNQSRTVSWYLLMYLRIHNNGSHMDDVIKK